MSTPNILATSAWFTCPSCGAKPNVPCHDGRRQRLGAHDKRSKLADQRNAREARKS
jgi:hypothetical protein